jgi:hypothetical protein
MLTPTKLICALALALALATGVTSTASAARGMDVAVQDDDVLFAGINSTANVGLKLAGQLHATYIRVNVLWDYVVGSRAARATKKPKKLAYNWSGYDALVSNASAHGMKLQLVLTGPAPAWASGDHKIGPVKPKASYFKLFASAAAQHFKGRVDRYSIWNEPNYRGWLSPTQSAPAVYRALYIAGYSAIKRADPSAKVFIGETAPYGIGSSRHINATPPLQFLRAVTCANASYKPAGRCGTLKTDGYAHHPYDFTHAPTYRFPGSDNVTIGVLGRLTSALSKLRKAKLLTTPTGGVPFVYLTEYGYFGSGARRVKDPTRGKYLVQAFTIAEKNPRVKEMLQYLLIQPGRNFTFFDTSIATRSGKPTAAFKALATWAAKAAKAGQIAVKP